MIQRISYLSLTILFLLVISVWAGQTEKEKSAISAAERWLSLVDNGKYRESWKEAAEYFRAAVDQIQWSKTLQAVRRPLGEVISRKIKSATYTTSLPGAPDGEYVVIKFETSFKNKRSAVETITPMMDRDGRWRVSGYYIR
jgi:hypothetical protein